ncbi:unnamed protein product, partial [Hapterophycus canaliculatus]
MKQEGADARRAKDWPYFRSPMRDVRWIHDVFDISAFLTPRRTLCVSLVGGLLDTERKQPLLRPEALEAAMRLREHIVAGCCSDAPKQAVHFKTGKDPETLCALFCCVRGMNDLEGYH